MILMPVVQRTELGKQQALNTGEWVASGQRSPPPVAAGHLCEPKQEKVPDIART